MEPASMGRMAFPLTWGNGVILFPATNGPKNTRKGFIRNLAPVRMAYAGSRSASLRRHVDSLCLGLIGLLIQRTG